MIISLMLKNVPKEAKGAIEVTVYNEGGSTREVLYLDTNEKKVDVEVFAGDRIGIEKFYIGPVVDVEQSAAVPPLEVQPVRKN